MEKSKNHLSSIKETNNVNISYDPETNNKIINEYKFIETLGKGSYSKVKRAINMKNNKQYAVKILNKRILRKKKKSYGRTSEGTLKINYMIEDSLNEIEIYKQFPQTNQNVLKLYEILNDDSNDKTYLIMELAEHGAIVSLDEKTGIFSLNQCLDNTKYNEQLMKKIIRDLANGLAFLHEHNIVHRDIKSDNIVLNKEGECKIADFGMALKLKGEDKYSKTEGNLFFYPPEFCDGKEKKVFGYKPVDVWALGVTIYTCIFKRLPFLPDNHNNVMELFRMINTAKVNYNREGIKISNEMKELLGHILEKDPKKRYTARQIAEDPWLKGKKN
jgi:serine/threonine protein kinase